MKKIGFYCFLIRFILQLTFHSSTNTSTFKKYRGILGFNTIFADDFQDEFENNEDLNENCDKIVNDEFETIKMAAIMKTFVRIKS